jgi:endonuclease-8
VPEGDTIHRSAARLHAAIAGKRLASALDIRRDTRGRRPPEAGTQVVDVSARGKHLLVRFADGQVLHTHMQMTGAWHIYQRGDRWRRPGHTARVVLEVDDGTIAVCFAAPLVELRSEAHDRVEPSFAAQRVERLGPDLCEPEPDFDAVLAGLRLLDPATEIGVALLDQNVAAGIGNVYKSEVCWIERVSPFAPLGAVDEEMRGRLFATAHRLLRANLGSGRRVTYQGGLAVYGRAGRPCPRCRTRIARTRSSDAERVTFWCPTCQPAPGATSRATVRDSKSTFGGT